MTARQPMTSDLLEPSHRYCLGRKEQHRGRLLSDTQPGVDPGGLH